MLPPNTPQPFHEGERAMQELVGARERLAEIGTRTIRDYMPGQHREFFTLLPFVIIGSVDGNGQPWASILTNPAGFIQSPDPFSLEIKAIPPAFDPLNKTLTQGAQIGLLGLEPHTRRRNRMNGVVEAVGIDGFTVGVRQSFGNCPKYIQARKPEYIGDLSVPESAIHRIPALDDAAHTTIRRADTFFIATAYLAQHIESPHGVDVSHRGGKPGFVKVEADGTLTVPDFAGNLFFNTLGNLAVHPRAGLLFIDFENGDLLYLAVTAKIIFDPEEIAAHEGAERLLRFEVKEMLRVEAALPLHWGQAELSPTFARMSEQ